MQSFCDNGYEAFAFSFPLAKLVYDEQFRAVKAALDRGQIAGIVSMTATAVPGPALPLIASTMRCVVPKSEVWVSRLMKSPSPTAVGTARSTVAPPAMRPTDR